MKEQENQNKETSQNSTISFHEPMKSSFKQMMKQNLN